MLMRDYKKRVTIENLFEHNEKTVTLQGWVANKREGKGLVFLILRDGTGLCQCIFSADAVSEQVFLNAQSLGLESAVKVTGKVVKDERQVGGFEYKPLIFMFFRL